MARIILFGGHGRVALLTEPLLVARRDSFTAVVRNPDHIDKVWEIGADAVVADIEQLDVDALTKLVADHDAVVWSAGAGGGNPARTLAVDQDAAIRTMRAAEQAGVRRYVMVSYFDSSTEHGVDPSNPFFAYAEAKAAADARLRESRLDWTILGPSALTFEAGTGHIDTRATKSTQVSRQNVALTIAATLADDTTIGSTINFNDGETPIGEAIRS
ncbi:MAG: SDR family oxidoreductase [Leucobacter sp.]|nr:SDR family oxidoreductase [Leucobacter sp.]